MQIDTTHPNYPELQKRINLVAQRVLEWRAEDLRLEASKNRTNGRVVDASGMVATGEVETVGANQLSFSTIPEVLNAAGTT